MHQRLVIPALLLESFMDRFRSRPGCVVEAPLFVLEQAASRELLVPAEGPPHAGRCARFALRGTSCQERMDWRLWMARGAPSNLPLTVETYLFEDGQGFVGAVLEKGRVVPLDELWVPGASMKRWRRVQGCDEEGRALPNGGWDENDRFSRLRGALSSEVLHRLQKSSFCQIGAGGLGTIVAETLGRMGVGELKVVDHDRVEVPNLCTMGLLGESDLGQPKAAAIARRLKSLIPGLRVQGLAVEAEHPLAVAAAMGADVILTVPDHGRPRLQEALIATANLRPHLDIGTAVLSAEPLRAGADVRLILPGDACCLLCLGGIPRMAARDQAWNATRAGSLRTLNQMAAHLGLFLLERLFAGTLKHSTWMRIEMSHASEPVIRAMDPSPVRADCPICPLSGRGPRALEGPIVAE